MRGLKRQQAAALTNFVGCFLPALSHFFFLLFLTALNDLTGPSAGPLAQITYSIPFRTDFLPSDEFSPQSGPSVYEPHEMNKYHVSFSPLILILILIGVMLW